MWEYNKNIAQGMSIIYVLEPFASESSHLISEAVFLDLYNSSHRTQPHSWVIANDNEI